MARKTQFPPSVKAGIPQNPTAPEGWQLVSFEDVIQVAERPAELENEQEYQLVTAKRSRGGIVPREKLLGKQILTKTQFYTNAGDFLISKRQIIHGACGLVPPDLDGAIVSNEYSTLLTTDKLLKEYLAYLSHTTYFQQTCFQSSVGVDVEKMIFKLDDWLKNKFPLPPIAEQKKIAEILGSVDEAIAATQAVIDQTRKVKQGLLQQLLTRGIGHTKFKETAIGLIPESWKVASMEDVLVDIIPGRTPESQRRPANADEWGILKVSAIGFGKFLAQENKVLPKDYEIESKYIVQAGDILITRANTSELVGATCIVPDGSYKLILSDKTLRIVPQTSKIIPGFLCEVLLSPVARKFFRENATGTSGSMKNITQELIRAFILPVPPLKEQERIVEMLNSFTCEHESHMKQLKHLQSVKQGLMQDLLTGRVRVGAVA